ncbi:MAG: succinate--CoA ligase subunit alpha [Candidatus Thermoplasmatota archaeon]
MAIILNENTRLLVQGITGHQGAYHTKAMLEYGTKIVGGVTPGKGGEKVEGIEVFDTIAGAMAKVNANASIIFVPAPYVKDAVYEALDAGIKTLVIITEHIPVHDSMEIMEYGKSKNAVIVGPNTPGVISPGKKAKAGIMPSKIFVDGNIGVISRSGTLTYEIVNEMSLNGYGQTTCIGLGGDPITGLTFTDALKMFENDDETSAIVIVGEIGGAAEEEAAKYIKDMKKNVYAYIAGQTAPPGKRMGHAGAIILRGVGTAESKVKALTEAGAYVAKKPKDIPRLIREHQ